VNRLFLVSRLFIIAVFSIVLIFSWQNLSNHSGAFAQETTSDSTAAESSDSDAANSDSAESTKPVAGRSLFGMAFAGDLFGVGIVIVIILLSIVSAFFVIEHAITISKNKLMPEYILLELEQRIESGQLSEAIEFCQMPENYCMTSDVILAGLERFEASEFGFAEYKAAVEEAGEDHTGALYRKTEALGVIGAIAPMMGLTGTVLGMITAFNMLAATDGTAEPKDLAGGIGQALITTLFGLVVAIPTMVAYSFFRNKIDSIVAEAGKRIERIMMPLGRKR
jgi:biopolymer transport protein ExbB